MGHPVYKINYDTIQKQKILKVYSLNFGKVFELKGKPGRSSVNALLNKSSSVNPLPFPYISLNLNHNAYSIFPCIYVRRERMACNTKVHFNFTRA